MTRRDSTSADPPQRLGVVDQLGGAAHVGRPVAPVGHRPVESAVDVRSKRRPRSLVIQWCTVRPWSRAASSASSSRKERGLGGPRGVHELDVGVAAPAHERADHRHHRVRPLPAVSMSSGRGCSADEVALRRAEEEHVTRLGAVDEGLGDRADRGDRDGRVLAARRRQRVGAPLPHTVDVDADPGPLAGLVGVPAATRAEVDRGRVGGLAVDAGDDAAQLARGGQGVSPAQEVLGRVRRREDRREARERADAGIPPSSQQQASESPTRAYSVASSFIPVRQIGRSQHDHRFP